jgi:cytochrome c-type biogenesis protein CcmH/NrfG
VSPEDTEAELGMAAALRGQGDDKHQDKFVQAQQLLEAVLKKDGHNVAALFNLGVLLADFEKNPGKAAEYFKRFLADAPGDHPMRAAAQEYLVAASAPGVKK